MDTYECPYDFWTLLRFIPPPRFISSVSYYHFSLNLVLRGFILCSLVLWILQVLTEDNKHFENYNVNLEWTVKKANKRIHEPVDRERYNAAAKIKPQLNS